ncbi:MAG: sulfatase-like hydrolase/transferase [Chloroflexota bacterium]
MKPNIIVILTDQQRADTLGCYGNRLVQTPHLDALAHNGVRFERAYCATPLCTPSRVSIQCGAYPHRHGIVDLWSEVPNERYGPVPGWTQPSPEELPWMGEYFRDGGYETAYVGKWHCMTGGDRRGFEDYLVRTGAFDIDEDKDNEWLRHALAQGYDLPGGKGVGSDYQVKELNYGVSVYQASDFPATYHFHKAIEFIQQDHERPFILFLSTTSPHPPFAPPAPYDQLYNPDDIVLPDNVHHYASPKRFIELRGHPRSFRRNREATEAQLRASWAHYLGMVSHLDDLTGELIQALEAARLRGNTLIVFSSDHGEMLGSHRLQDKGAFMYDEVMRVPLLVNWPGEASPAVYETPVSQVSLLPTLLEIAGIPPRSEFDMPSLAESFLGQHSPAEQPVYGEYNRFYGQSYPVRMVVDGRWKYVHYFGPEPELFDLEDDPGETVNLVGSATHQEELRRMQGLLETWMAASGDVYQFDQEIVADFAS